jgi:hypothetical protein
VVGQATMEGGRRQRRRELRSKELLNCIKTRIFSVQRYKSVVNSWRRIIGVRIHPVVVLVFSTLL